MNMVVLLATNMGITLRKNYDNETPYGRNDYG